jgi:hypothetical protein
MPARFAKAGSEPKNRRDGAPKGERPPARGLRKRSARGRKTRRSASAGLRHWPAKGASQAPERLSALRPLTCVMGTLQTSEEHLPRENEDACPRL